MSDSIEPCHLEVSETDLDDLAGRLSRVRWPQPTTVDDTSQGPTLAKLTALVDYWRDQYDWRSTERRLNKLGQFHTVIDGLDFHFLHVRSAEPDAMPLLMTHGWPESILDFEKVIAPLTDPSAHGGKWADAFDVIIPALPGFGFSGKPSEPGWGIERTADAWITLMRRLGYSSWAAHGADIGMVITETIARKKPDGLVGVHFPFAVWPNTPEERAEATEAEQAMLAESDHFWTALSGYCTMQMTRPQTIGFSLDDSPVGLAAWLYSLIQDGCGTRGEAEKSFTYDELIDLIMMYWLPKAGASSARMYWEMAQNSHLADDVPAFKVDVPAGFTMFPYDHLRKSRRWIEARYTNIVRFTEAERGGHFAAIEQPAVLVAELRATFAGLR